MPPNPEVSHKKIAAIAMAAGAGSRFGHQPKSLLQRDGEPLIARQLRLLAEAGIEQTVVVLGHHAPRVAPVLATLKANRRALRMPVLVATPSRRDLYDLRRAVDGEVLDISDLRAGYLPSEALGRSATWISTGSDSWVEPRP